MKRFHKKNLSGSEPISVQNELISGYNFFREKSTYNSDFVGLWSA